MLEGDFALCISLYHGYELLMQMGLRSLFFYIQGIMDGSRGESPPPNLPAAFKESTIRHPLPVFQVLLARVCCVKFVFVFRDVPG